MVDYQRFFEWPNVQIAHFYAYLGLALVVAAYLVFRSRSAFKFELFFISFYLLTGNINDLLIIRIPGFSLFEIQPVRLIFILLGILLLRKTLLSKNGIRLFPDGKIPWFILALGCYILFQISAVLVNSTEMELSDVLVSIYDSIAFFVLLIGLQIMADRPTYTIIGRTMIIGAVAELKVKKSSNEEVR